MTARRIRLVDPAAPPARPAWADDLAAVIAAALRVVSDPALARRLEVRLLRAHLFTFLETVDPEVQDPRQARLAEILGPARARREESQPLLGPGELELKKEPDDR